MEVHSAVHLHFHHDHDIAGCINDHPHWPDWALALFATRNRRELQLMASVQDSLAAAVTVINELVTEVGNLKAQISPAVDTSALDAAVSAAQAVLPQPAPAPLVEPAPAPASSDVPAPADVPAQPAEVSTPAADGTVPVQTVPSVPLA